MTLHLKKEPTPHPQSFQRYLPGLLGILLLGVVLLLFNLDYYYTFGIIIITGFSMMGYYFYHRDFLEQFITDLEINEEEVKIKFLESGVFRQMQSPISKIKVKLFHIPGRQRRPNCELVLSLNDVPISLMEENDWSLEELKTIFLTIKKLKEETINKEEKLTLSVINRTLKE